MSKDERPCPNCGMPIMRKNFRRTVKRCPSCYVFTCEYCRVLGLCLDCYNLQIRESESYAYFGDKYGVEA